MVANLEKIKLVTKHRVEKVENSFYEMHNDFIFEKTFVFEKGKIYGIIGEYGEGGELISSLLSGRVPIKKEEVYYDGIQIDNYNMQKVGWYVGKKEYYKSPIKREKSVEKALRDAMKEYKRYIHLEDIIEEFHLTPDRLNYKLSQYSGERWRASLAIGYACKKEVYCFSWMNTSDFNSILLSSGVFRFFNKMKKEDLIIILPTCRKENVIGLADEIIEINNPEYKCIISENSYFIEHF